MVKLTPMVRVILIGVAAAISVIAATQDSLPLWAQAIIAGLSTILAGLGIVPPHIPTITLAQKVEPTETVATQPPPSASG